MNYSRLSLVVCHAVGTLHYQTPILKLEIRVGPGALDIETHQQIAVTYQQASVRTNQLALWQVGSIIVLALKCHTLLHSHMV